MPRKKLPDVDMLKFRVPKRMKQAIFQAAADLGVTATDYLIFILDAWLKQQGLYREMSGQAPEAETDRRRRLVTGELKRQAHRQKVT